MPAVGSTVRDRPSVASLFMLRRWFGHTTMADIDRQLPRSLRRHRRRRTVVVVARDPRQVARLQIGNSRWGRARVVPVIGGSSAQLHRELAALGRVALVVDARGSSGPVQLSEFEQNFFHLSPHSAWVSLRRSGPTGRGEPMVDLARRIADRSSRRELERSWREHARSVADVRVTPDMVVMSKRRKHLLRLSEAEAPGVLRSREPGLRVTQVARLDAGVLDTEGRMHDYGVEPDLKVPAVLPYPEHTVWRYEGRVHLPRHPLAYHGRTVLPDSFRWHLDPELAAPGVVNVDQHFGVLRNNEKGPTFEGAYFNFLYGNPGHFGHLMTEALARLWGWRPAKEADPSLRILVRQRPGLDAPDCPEARLLPAFGIAPEDIVWVDGPVTVTRLVGCTPMWHNAPPFYAHPAIRETWSRLRIGLIGSEPVDEVPPIFVTRRQWNRPCSNVEEVERFFSERGFRIVVPEELSVTEQVAMFAGARVVAGFGGAGLFNLAYAESVETVIVLNQSAYHARNEHLFAAVQGAELHSFWSSPLLEHPPGGYSQHAHQSPWTFAFEQNAEPLDRLLRRLVQ
jgi:capsular polysaccharide biosynthesis protein